MTKDEADERVRMAEQEVIRCAKFFGEKFETQSGVHAAVTKLLEAEAARAALDMPRLMTPRDRARTSVVRCFLNGRPVYAEEYEAGEQRIKDDRADILAHAEKLPRLSSEHLSRRYCDYSDAIFLSDLRNLLEGK